MLWVRVSINGHVGMLAYCCFDSYLYINVFLCAVVCCCVLLCAAVCCCVLLCAAVCCCVLLYVCVSVCLCVLLCIAVYCCVLLVHPKAVTRSMQVEMQQQVSDLEANLLKQNEALSESTAGMVRALEEQLLDNSQKVSV